MAPHLLPLGEGVSWRRLLYDMVHRAGIVTANCARGCRLIEGIVWSAAVDRTRHAA